MIVSVIIPVFNRQDLAVAALRSALADPVAGREVVVVDDGSAVPFALPDDLSGRDDVRLIRLDRNRGPSAARNAGIAAASGRWIAFLDSDDRWMPGKLERQLAFAEADQAASPHPLTVYATGFVYVWPDGRQQCRIPAGCEDAVGFASGIWFAPGSTCLVPRALAGHVGPWDETIVRIEDLDWFLRIGLAGGRLRVLQEVLVDIDVHGKPPVAVVDRGAETIARKWLDTGVLAERSPSAARHLAAYLDVERAAARWYAGQRLAGLRHLARSLAAVPRPRVSLRRFWRIVPPSRRGCPA